jgi:hypothetical protein
LLTILARSKPPIRVTSDIQLHTWAGEIAKHPTYSEWVIVVSGRIHEISFDINANVSRLHIERVNEVDPEGTLLVSGSSKWNGIQLDQWLERPHKRTLTHNKGVSIFANNFGLGPWGTASLDSFREDDRKGIQSYLQQISNQEMDGSWWEAWTVLKCSAKGFFISFNYGPIALKAGGFSLKLLAGLKVAALPVAVGLGVAGLIYFFPWDKFFNWLGSWLKRIFRGIWDTICNLWDQLWSGFLTWQGQQPKCWCN